MDPAKIILLAIAVLGVLLIGLIIYLVIALQSAKSDALPEPLDEDAPTPPVKQDETAATGPTDARASLSGKEPQPPEATAQTRVGQLSAGWSAAPSSHTDRSPTPPQRDDRTPAGGTESYQANRPVTGRVAPALAPPQPTMPRRRGTVAMNAGFLNDQIRQDPAASRATPVASTARVPSSRPSTMTPPGATASAAATPRRPITPVDTNSRPVATGRDALFQQFRDVTRSTNDRLEVYKRLLATLDEEDRVLLNVEAINSDLMELQLVALEELNVANSDTLMDELIPLVESPSPDIALGALKALSNVGGPIVEQTMLAAMESNHPVVRAHARSGLLDHATPTLQDQLRDMLQDDDEKTIKIAATLLGELGGPQNAELLRTRAALLPATSPVRGIVSVASESAASKSARVTGGHAPFSGAQEVVSGSDIAEFEMTLDPELFNPKS